MTEEQHNKFLTLLMGECWHEWQEIFLTNNHTVSSVASLRCKHCETDKYFATENYDYLSNPLPVLNWMREHMPEEWEEYLLHIFSTTWTLKLSDDLFRILDLRNLVQYLKEHTEAPFMWGFTPCPSFPSCMSGETDKCDFPDKGCEGDGKVRGHIHPALKFLREIR